MSQPFLGEIKIFAGPYNPPHYSFCNGQLLSVSQYQALFSVLGTTYGGDGRTTFGLPEMRGRAPMHAGSGLGLTPRVQGQSFGTTTVTLTLAQIPEHSHPFNASEPQANSESLESATLSWTDEVNWFTPPSTPGITPVQFNDVAVGFAGNSEAHENQAPALVLNYIIALQGLFPPRN